MNSGRVARSLAMLAMLAGALSAAHPVAADDWADSSLPSSPSSFELIGVATIPPLRFAGTVVGGLSGLVYDARVNTFFALSDDRGSAETESRIYRLAIDLSDGQLDEGDVNVVGRTFLRDASGRPYEPATLDLEGLALDPRGGFFVATEGVASKGIAPMVASFGENGVERGRFELPTRFQPDAAGDRGVRDNLGFEGLAVTPDGQWLVAALENALIGDGPAADVGVPSAARIVYWPLDADRAGTSRLPEREVVYPLAPVSLATTPGAYRVNGLSEIVALTADSILGLEREFAAGSGLKIRLQLASARGASEVQTVERLAGAEFTPMAKTLLVDFADLGVPLDNFEAMSFGPRLRDGRRTLLVLSDDNFDSVAQRTLIVALAVGERPLSIADLQGRAHRSPYEGKLVAGIQGVVTAIDRRSKSPGFAIESTEPDADPKTSEAIWVASVAPDEVGVGTRVRVAGKIEERAANEKQLPVTTLAPTSIEPLAAAAGLPPPVALGSTARIPPQLDGDALADFRPERDAIDFWESLESMRVELPASIVSGPTLSYGEAVLIADEGNEEELTDAGGRLLFPGGPDLERFMVGKRFLEEFPPLAVGTRLAGPSQGIVDYSFSSFKVQLLAPPIVVAAGFDCGVKTRLRSEGDRLTLATLNVENLSAAGPPERFERIARVVVERLASPAIVALEEIQDDSGTVAGDGIVGAERTLANLTDAITAAGGPRYQPIAVDPEIDREGGQPGGNIRVALLVDPARAGFTPRGKPGPLVAAGVFGMEETLRLEPNPGRVAPTSPAFTLTTGEGVRRSLAVELVVGGQPLFVIANHWSSKWDDDRAFGAVQPPRQPTEERRLAQALVVREFVERLLAADSQARIVVLGDLNDLPWSEPVERLSAPPMSNLLARVPAASRYTYNFEGSSQAIDYIVVSRSLAGNAEAEIVHLDSNCPDPVRVSDHDPVVASVRVAGKAGRRER